MPFCFNGNFLGGNVAVKGLVAPRSSWGWCVVPLFHPFSGMVRETPALRCTSAVTVTAQSHLFQLYWCPIKKLSNLINYLCNLKTKIITTAKKVGENGTVLVCPS